MAEVVASAVGIAAFAVQTGEKILKLLAIIESVRDAPCEVRYLLDEINILHRILAEFSSSYTNDLDGKRAVVVSEVEQLCLHSTEILSRVVEEISVDITKNRMLGSLKAIAKKDNVERLRDRGCKGYVPFFKTAVFRVRNPPPLPPPPHSAPFSKIMRC